MSWTTWSAPVRRDISPSIVADCARKGVAAVSLFTSGFAETEQEEGVRLQRELGELARENGLLLIGPNCMGIYNPRLGLRQSPEQPAGEAGNVGFISRVAPTASTSASWATSTASAAARR